MWLNIKGENPKTVHFVKEKTLRGPKDREQFFISQNGEFEDFIIFKTFFLLLIKRLSHVLA